MPTEKVDVVIPVKDEGFKLQYCCKSVLKHIPVDNLIIVVSPSEDNTLEIARQYGNEIIIDENKGVGHARAVGLEKVETEYYASIDADIIIPKIWYPTCMKKIKKPLVAACQGYDRPLGRNYSKWLPFLIEKAGAHSTLGNTILRTDVIKEVGIPTIPWFEDCTLRDLLESKGYTWITDFDLIVTHWVYDIDILRHYIRFGRQQKPKLRELLYWIGFSFKDFMKPKYPKNRDLNLSVYKLLARLARCYGSLQAFGRSDSTAFSIPFW